MKPLKSKFHTVDWLILGIVLAMVFLGVLIVFDASYAQALQKYHDVYYFAKLQAGWVLVGLISLIVSSLIPISWYQRFSKPFFILSFLLLFLVLLPFISQEINGAHRWLHFGPFNMQPSELMKMALILYLPQWLLKSSKVIPFLILIGSVLGLVMLEPDMGTAVIMCAIIGTAFFLSGIAFKKIITVVLFGLCVGVLIITISPYRRSRIATYLNPGNDPLGASYHIRQVLLSIGSGGVFGTGLGRSRQKYQYIPEVTTDSIFAVIAEEMGIWGGLLTIIGFAAISFRGWQTVKTIKLRYARLVAAGVIIWISTQAIINLSAMVALVPLTGVPLPFISYGGSSLVMMLSAVGIYLNMSRYRR